MTRAFDKRALFPGFFDVKKATKAMEAMKAMKATKAMNQMKAVKSMKVVKAMKQVKAMKAMKAMKAVTSKGFVYKPRSCIKQALEFLKTSEKFSTPYANSISALAKKELRCALRVMK